jgi:hypothetical protein
MSSRAKRSTRPPRSFQLANLFRRELAVGSHFQMFIGNRPDANALQGADRMANCVAYLAYLARPSFVNRHANHRRAFLRAAFRERFDLRGTRTAAVNDNASC